jgi:hypothetical protein
MEAFVLKLLGFITGILLYQLGKALVLKYIREHRKP